MLFATVSLIAVYPIVPHLGSRVLGWKGDNVQYVYTTGWFAQSFLLKQSPFFDPRLNYPDGLALTTTDVPFVNLFAVLPVTLLGGPVLGYNGVILMSHFLSGYFVYLWLVRLTKSRVGAVIGGLSFLLMPYRIVHSYGHLQLISTQALPLFFWALDHALSSPLPSFRKWLFLGGATALVAGMCMYYLVMSFIIGAAYALLTVLPRLGPFLRQVWKPVVTVLIGALVGAVPYLITMDLHVMRRYAVAETRIWSAFPFDFLVPSRLHLLWGHWVERYYPRPTWVEHTLYLGLIAVTLAIVAVFGARQEHKRRVYAWCAVIGVAILFALGTDLHLSSNPLSPTRPIWLPAYYLAHLPVAGFMRCWSRFGVIAMLFTSLLAGMGASLLIQRWHRHSRLVGIVCIALLVIDFLPGKLASTEIAPRPIDRWLAAQPGEFAVAFLPIGHQNYEAMFGSLLHGKHLPAIHHPQHVPKAFLEFMSQASAFPNRHSVEALRDMGFRYLIVRKDHFNGQGVPDWEAVEKTLAPFPFVRFIANIDGYVIIGFT